MSILRQNLTYDTGIWHKHKMGGEVETALRCTVRHSIVPGGRAATPRQTSSGPREDPESFYLGPSLGFCKVEVWHKQQPARGWSGNIYF